MAEQVITLRVSRLWIWALRTLLWLALVCVSAANRLIDNPRVKVAP
jgi:hypothetical protein